jgi:hypothetical protein
MCVDCVLASPRITHDDPGVEPLTELVLSHSSCVGDERRLEGHVARGLRLFMTHDQKQEMVCHTSLSHKEYVTFGDDKKGKVLSTGIIKVNDCFTLNDVAFVNRLRYSLLSVSQLCDADLSVLFHKFDSHVIDSSSNHVCGISRIGNVFQANFSSVQSSLRSLILQSSSEL